jgi:hypothetical protein
MFFQLVTQLVHIVTNMPAVHTAPGPVATPVTVITTTVSSSVNHGFDVLQLTPW